MHLRTQPTLPDKRHWNFNPDEQRAANAASRRRRLAENTVKTIFGAVIYAKVQKVSPKQVLEAAASADESVRVTMSTSDALAELGL
jgi:hypothetical protein